ncbi:TetR/AcrR family transcriptional regulator [Methylopila musalis]|uniref:TetR/AcrR family transcriptional regulator n=1 Tax=Methylopila musalis TaxID=1134781 RepID=A0ABW3Z3G1_9HYPH
MSETARRASLIAAARDLFMEGGYAALSTNAVAARAKVSKRSLYEAFDSIDALFAAVVADHSGEMLRIPPDDDMPLDEALVYIFHVDIGEEDDERRHAFLRAATLDRERFPQVHATIMAKGLEPSRKRLADWLADQARKNRIIAPEPERLARVLMDLVMSSSVFHPGSREAWPDRRQRADHIRYCIHVALDGVRARPGP